MNPIPESVPPSDLPLVKGLPLPSEAEAKAVIDYEFKKAGEKPGPLMAWLVKRENAYFEGCGKHWGFHLHTYAAARDAACWQLGLTEAALLKRLPLLKTL